jgi:AraC-like DNA-binding protein
MKPQFFLVPRDVQKTHIVRHHTLPNFGTVWHYHPELEFHYIIRGEGVRFVGDDISNFNAGELLLLGENIPHMWRCNEAYFKKDESVTAEAIVIQFLPEFIGKDFLYMKEAAPILNLYEKAKSGLVISGSIKDEIIGLMNRSVSATGLQRIICILSMLELLVDNDELVPIASPQETQKFSSKENERLNNVYNYTLKNFGQELTLEEVASVANLSVTSFCRYFKKMTQKTFHDFLIQVRISHAKRMLIENEASMIENVCYECGFNNKSNFFEHFKRTTGRTPQEYRRQYLNDKGR